MFCFILHSELVVFINQFNSIHFILLYIFNHFLNSACLRGDAFFERFSIVTSWKTGEIRRFPRRCFTAMRIWEGPKNRRENREELSRFVALKFGDYVFHTNRISSKSEHFMSYKHSGYIAGSKSAKKSVAILSNKQPVHRTRSKAARSVTGTAVKAYNA